jgi:PIN domain nuclease of toxin-antitoxin system
MTLAVTDTHALIWYATGPQRKLGRGARAVFERAERGDAVIYVPTLVLVELAEAMRRGIIRADEGFSRWSERLLDGRRFVAADLTAAVVREAEGLYSIPERGDRLVAATAVHLGCPLLTKDPAIARIRTVTTVW